METQTFQKFKPKNQNTNYFPSANSRQVYCIEDHLSLNLGFPEGGQPEQLIDNLLSNYRQVYCIEDHLSLNLGFPEGGQPEQLIDNLLSNYRLALSKIQA